MADSSLFVPFAAIDIGIVRALNAWVGVSPDFDRVVHLINGSAMFKGVPFVTALWWLSRKEKTVFPEIDLEFALRWVGALFVALVLARFLQHYGPVHVRPLTDPTLGVRPFMPDDPNILTKLNSFPSDHAIEFFGLSYAIWSRKKWLGWFAFVWTVILICLPRVYFGYHYPSDLLIGALIGVTITAVFLNIEIPRFVCRIITRAEEKAPGVTFAACIFVSLQIVNNFNFVREVMNMKLQSGA